MTDTPNSNIREILGTFGENIMGDIPDDPAIHKAFEQAETAINTYIEQELDSLVAVPVIYLEDNGHGLAVPMEQIILKKANLTKNGG